MNARRIRLAAVLSVAAVTTLGTGPALAGQDITIELQNNLTPSEPLYPRLMVKSAGDWFCWYLNDLKSGRPAPAGGGFSNTSSEVQNTFFSFCNPAFNPLKGALVRYAEFKLFSQATPGAEWKPVTWGDGGSAMLLTYFSFPMDVRGYHFQIGGPSPISVLNTPAGPACMTVAPDPFNYTNLYRFKVSMAQDGKCSLPQSATAQKQRVPTRTVKLRVGRTKPVVLGPVVKAASSRWKASQCTSDHFDATASRIEKGPGASRWHTIDVRGTSAGEDRCLVSLIGGKGQKLLTQRIIVEVE